MTVKEKAEKYFIEGVKCQINKDFEGAVNYFTKATESYSKAIESDVNDKDIYRNRGIAYIGIVNYAKAIEDLTKAIELGANDGVIYGNRGIAYLHLEDYTEAIEDLTKAIELGANDEVIYGNRGIAYFHLEDYTKAIEDYTKAIEIVPNDKAIYENRGIAYSRQKDYTKAIEDFTQVIELDANNKTGYASRGFVYLHIKDYTKAIEDFTKAIELDENDKDGYNGRGHAYIDAEEYIKAIEDFTKAIELDENDKDAYNGRGRAYIGVEKYIKAIEDFTRAIELDASDESSYIWRGFVYLCIEDYTKAIEDFTEIIELGANNKLVYRLRGFAYVYKKDYTEAIDDFTQIIKLHKNGKEENKHTGNSDYALGEIKLTDNILNLIDDILQKNESKVLPDDETLNLIELVCYCYDLMDEIKIEPSEVKGEKFVHYTKAGSLQYLLKKDYSAKLRLNNAVYMNDPEEGQVLKKVLCQLDQNNELEKLFKDEDVKNYTYLTCFCPYDKRDELPMWIHYGDGGKGIGLVFHDSFFDKVDLYKVQYIDIKNFDTDKLDQNIRDKIKITPIFEFLKRDEIKNNNHKEFKDYVNIILNYVSYLFKDKAYEYENEVRILRYRDYGSQDIKTDDVGRDIPRLFIEYDECITDKNCVEVIAGPKAQYTEIAAYAKYVGIQKVSQSEIKYR